MFTLTNIVVESAAKPEKLMDWDGSKTDFLVDFLGFS